MKLYTCKAVSLEDFIVIYIYIYIFTGVFIYLREPGKYTK